MNIPQNLLYARTHEWARAEGGIVTVGLSDYAQQELGDLVFVNLPSVGDTIEAGDTLGDVESVKAVSDVYCPASGTITEVNEALADNPALINEKPYEAWLVRIEGEASGDLLDAAAYGEFCRSESEKD